MENTAVLYQQLENVALVTLNRPEVYNCINQELMLGLVESLQKAEQDKSVHAVVLTGSGTKAFCAGLDLKELSGGGDLLLDDTLIVNTFAQRKKPLIGAINGYTMTGGLEMALNCDILYASENAVFADTHCKVGIMPTWGMTQKLPRLIGYGRAKEMSFTGRKIDAQTALAWGLVNRVFPSEQLVEAALQLASEIASLKAASIQKLKHLIDGGEGMEIKDALAREREISQAHNVTIDFGEMTAKLNQMRGKK